jgi:3-dehydroquinate dehydratase / shikimate dehydrogenase
MKSNSARICVPVCVRHVGELAAAIERAKEMADIVEVRLDYLEESEITNSVEEISAAIVSGRPVILTLRPAEFGGARAISVSDRLYFRIHNSILLWGEKWRADLWDLELDLALLYHQSPYKEIHVAAARCDWTRTICSYHDFVGVPANLEEIYESMAATESRILKIAVQADDATDCLAVFHLLERAQREGREMIAVGMGPAGIMTRILGPSRGSFLTYGAFDDENATAPGQLTARELREVYRIDKINRRTEVFGIMGKPVGHSLSPHIHNAAFQNAGVNAVYLPFEVSDVDQFMRRMVHPRSRELKWNLRGLSVTAPHKSAVMNCLDWIDPTAKEMGAVNTILIRDDELRGYNTDAAAFIAPLKRKFGSLQGARCAVIGAGGGARAALWALRRAGATTALFVRNPEQARRVAAEFTLDSQPLAAASFAGFDIVVNATPLGTRGISERDTVAIADQFRGVRLAYDLVYNPLETRFLREARAAGCETLGGIEMLLAQAVEQYKLWIGSDPDAEVMRAAALRALVEPEVSG